MDVLGPCIKTLLPGGAFPGVWGCSRVGALCPSSAPHCLFRRGRAEEGGRGEGSLQPVWPGGQRALPSLQAQLGLPGVVPTTAGS